MGIPLAVRGLPVLLATTLLVTALALWLPLAWPLRAAAAGLVYAAVMWITGIIAPGDRSSTQGIPQSYGGIGVTSRGLRSAARERTASPRDPDRERHAAPNQRDRRLPSFWNALALSGRMVDCGPAHWARADTDG
ncbi:MAG: hypothetical protein R3A10_10860 [Caldilineaceae bacterium]